MLKNFKINSQNEDTTLLDNIFDFVIIGLVAVVFSSLGQSLVKHSLLNICFSIGNLIMISSTWYAYNFYSMRYQVKSSFHFWVIVPIILSLIILGIGIKSSYTSITLPSKVFLIFGFISSRLLISSTYIFVDIVNKNKAISALTRWKYISRILNVIILCINLVFNFIDIKYLFLIMSLIEVVGNVLQVRNKYLNMLPPIDFEYSKSRFTKLNSLYIGSFLISSINFYSNYVNKDNMFSTISHLLAFVTFGIIIWIVYYQRITKFEIDNCAKTLLLFSTSTLIIDIGTSIIGSTFLYIDDFANMDSKIPIIGLLILVVGLFTFLYSAKWPKQRKGIKSYKQIEYLIYILASILLLIFDFNNIGFSLLFIFIILIALLLNYKIQKKFVQKKQKI